MNLFDAIRLATRAHAGQFRADGTPYIEHPLTVLRLLWRFNLNLPLEAYIAAILHDVLEDTHITYENILLAAGPDVAAIVRVLTKDDVYYALPRSIREHAYLRRIESISQIFPYALLIKMADRLHNISTAYALTPANRQRLLKETEIIYLPFLERYLRETEGSLQESYQSCANILQKTLSCVHSSYAQTDHQPESKETVTSH